MSDLKAKPAEKDPSDDEEQKSRDDQGDFSDDSGDAFKGKALGPEDDEDDYLNDDFEKSATKKSAAHLISNSDPSAASTDPDTASALLQSGMYMDLKTKFAELASTNKEQDKTINF
jgi:hypothetical protein